MSAIKEYLIRKIEEKGLDPTTVFENDEMYDDFISELAEEERQKKEDKKFID